MIVPTAIAQTIGKLIPRLASDHDGEVVATARAIERLLKAGGRDWHDLAASVCVASPPKSLFPTGAEKPPSALTMLPS